MPGKPGSPGMSSPSEPGASTSSSAASICSSVMLVKMPVIREEVRSSLSAVCRPIRPSLWALVTEPTTDDATSAFSLSVICQSDENSILKVSGSATPLLLAISW